MSQQITVSVPIGNTLTITANAASSGTYYPIGNPGDAPGTVHSLAASASATVGPFNTPQNYVLISNNGVMSYSLGFVGSYDVTADQANEAATYQPILSGETITGATAATDDYVLIQDKSDSKNLKTVSAQSVADLSASAISSAVSAEASSRSSADSTLQSNIDAKAPLASPIFTTTALRTTVNNGTPNTGTTAVEYGDGMNHTTVLTVNTTLPAITGGVDQGVGKLLYTLPAGADVIDVAYMSVGITQSEGNINADTPVVGLGSVIATGAIADFTGSSTFDDLLTGQTAANCTGTHTVKTVANQVFVSESGGSKAINFNAANHWAASGDAAAAIAGTVVLYWKFVN